MNAYSEILLVNQNADWSSGQNSAWSNIIKYFSIIYV